MAKYDPLKRHLDGLTGAEILMSFQDIEVVIGASLPSSARRYREWWSNEVIGSHVQARSWVETGFHVEQVDFAREQVTFRRPLP